jgi:hypothetical protein
VHSPHLLCPMQVQQKAGVAALATRMLRQRHRRTLVRQEQVQQQRRLQLRQGPPPVSAASPCAAAQALAQLVGA